MANLTRTLIDSNDYLDDMTGEEFSEDFEELMDELSQVKGRWEIKGRLGLWNGKHQIEPVQTESLKEAILKCCGENDYIKIMTNDEIYFVDGVHHDGTNSFVITRVD